MRRMKRMMAVAILAAMATLSAQTTFAAGGVILSDNTGHRDGVILSDKDGVILSDKQSDNTLTNGAESWDSVVIDIISGFAGVILSD